MKRFFAFGVFFLLIAIGKSEVFASENAAIKIALYGYGGDNLISEVYLNEATKLGEFLADNQIIPISGCLSDQGNLPRTLESCVNKGGKIETVADKNSPLPINDCLYSNRISVEDYEQLKKHMFVNGKGYVFLPSGIGGLAAALEILYLYQKGVYFKFISFYNHNFWLPIIKCLQEMVGPLPVTLRITDNGLNMEDMTRRFDYINLEEVEKFFNSGYKDTRRKSRVSYRITLELLTNLLEIYYARIEGIHTKNIYLTHTKISPTRDTPLFSKEDSITFEISPWETSTEIQISPWEPLREILNHLHLQGFIKDEHLEMIQFKE